LPSLSCYWLHFTATTIIDNDNQLGSAKIR
jgi:hypothetical protein